MTPKEYDELIKRRFARLKVDAAWYHPLADAIYDEGKNWWTTTTEPLPSYTVMVENMGITTPQKAAEWASKQGSTSEYTDELILTLSVGGSRLMRELAHDLIEYHKAGLRDGWRKLRNKAELEDAVEHSRWDERE